VIHSGCVTGTVVQGTMSCEVTTTGFLERPLGHLIMAQPTLPSSDALHARERNVVLPRARPCYLTAQQPTLPSRVNLALGWLAHCGEGSRRRSAHPIHKADWGFCAVSCIATHPSSGRVIPPRMSLSNTIKLHRARSRHPPAPTQPSVGKAFQSQKHTLASRTADCMTKSSDVPPASPGSFLSSQAPDQAPTEPLRLPCHTPSPGSRSRLTQVRLPKADSLSEVTSGHSFTWREQSHLRRSSCVTEGTQARKKIRVAAPRPLALDPEVHLSRAVGLHVATLKVCCLWRKFRDSETSFGTT
jgi:hypothetical protein